MMEDTSQTHTIMITGCNRGLGLVLFLMLLDKNPEVFIFGTTRSNPQKLQAQLKEKTMKNNFKILELDIDFRESVEKVQNYFLTENIKLDALVNNSGIYIDLEKSQQKSQKDQIDEEEVKKRNKASFEIAQRTFATNFYGTVHLTKHLLQFIKDNGRIINVSSRYGALKHHGPSIQEFFSQPQISMGDIDMQINKFLECCKNGEMGDFFESPYGASKMILNAWSRFILKKMIKPTQQTICMSPGHCMTDMGGPKAKRSAEDGALSMYMLLWGEYSSEKFYHCDGVSDYENCGP